MKKLLALIPVVFGLIVLTGCKVGEVFGSPAPTATATPVLAPVSEDEYQVYAIAIPAMNWGRRGAPAVIKNQTCSYWDFEEDRSSLQQNLPGVQEETLADFAIQNKNTGSLQSGHSNFDYVVINTGDYLRPVKIGKEEHLSFNWELLRHNYPGSDLICVSRVGFNQAHTQAFLYAESGKAPLSSRGFYLLLVSAEEMWKIDQKMFLWKS